MFIKSPIIYFTAKIAQINDIILVLGDTKCTYSKILLILILLIKELFRSLIP